jgi:hypothetical protein
MSELIDLTAIMTNNDPNGINAKRLDLTIKEQEEEHKKSFNKYINKLINNGDES